METNQTLVGRDATCYIEKTLDSPMEALLEFPRYIMIETINWCNANCIMCGIDFSKKKRIAMSDGLFSSLTNQICMHKDHVKKVMLYLDCEPLGDIKLPARIGQMKEAGIHNVNIASNASMLTEQLGIKILDAGLDEIYITLDSLYKKTYESIRRGLKFETVYDNIVNFINIRNAKKSKCMIRIQQILQGCNQKEGDDFIRHWTPKLLESDQVIVQYAHSWANAVKIEQFEGEEDFNRLPCIGPFGTFCVHADGEGMLCSMDVNGLVPIGNVCEGGIREVWRDMALQEIRRIHISADRRNLEPCRHCNLWRKSRFEPKAQINQTKLHPKT